MSFTYLQELERRQKFSRPVRASVDVEPFQVGREVGSLVALVTHLHHGLRQGAADELRLALESTNDPLKEAVFPDVKSNTQLQG